MLQNVWLLFASLVFYAWGEPVYMSLMLGSILVNSLLGYGVERCARRKKGLLLLAIVLNVGVLFLFK